MCRRVSSKSDPISVLCHCSCPSPSSQRLCSSHSRRCVRERGSEQADSVNGSGHIGVALSRTSRVADKSVPDGFSPVPL